MVSWIKAFTFAKILCEPNDTFLAIFLKAKATNMTVGAKINKTIVSFTEISINIEITKKTNII